MNKNHNIISPSSYVTDIVNGDYRAASIFRKYGIDFCCGGKFPLEMVCANKNLDVTKVISEIQDATSTIHLTHHLKFSDWDIDFLIDYIIYVHHNYLRQAFPEIDSQLQSFTEKHIKKFPELGELRNVFSGLLNETIPHIVQEEEILFPYIRQLSHAYRDNESYATLLIRTLRKPIEKVMEKEHEFTGATLHRMRELTNNYTVPQNACVSHNITFSYLRELDNDLIQHIHLENNVLFPKAIAIEKELLEKN